MCSYWFLDQNNFLDIAIECGYIFNLFEPLQLSQGSLVLNLSKQILLTHANDKKLKYDLSNERLVKLYLVFQYVLMNEKKLNYENNAEKNAISNWYLNDFEQLMKIYYPKINYSLLEKMYRYNVNQFSAKLSNDQSLFAARNMIYPKSDEFLEIDKVDSQFTSNDEQLSGIWVFDYTIQTCPQFKIKTKVSNWIKFLKQNIESKTLNLFDADYCKKVLKFVP